MIDKDWWYQRGWEDGQKDKFPLFRKTRNQGVHAVSEWPHQEESEEEAGKEYLLGYDAGTYVAAFGARIVLKGKS